MKKLLIPDANTGGESSSLSATQATTAQTTQGAKSSDASEKESIEDVVQRIKDKYSNKETEGGESPTNAKKKDEESPVLQSHKTEDKTEDKEVGDKKESNTELALGKEDKDKKEASEEASVKDKSIDEYKDLPFHKHPRFKKLVTERTEYKEKLDSTTKEVETLRPTALRMQTVEKFCQENNIPPQDYDESLRLAALVNSKPAEALPRLKALISAIEIQLGTSLPVDLQSQVDEGKLSLTHAQEMSKLRLQASSSEHRIKQTQQTSHQRAQQELVTSLDSWTKTKISSDPSYKPKQQGQPDGKYELVQDRFLASWQQNPPKNTQDAVLLAENAYKSVHEFLERTLPRPQVKRPLSSKSSETEREKPIDYRKPGWAKEVARRQLAKA